MKYTIAQFLTLLLIQVYQSKSQLVPQPKYIPPDPSVGYLSNGNSTSVPPQTQWSNLLGNLLYFYEAQRSGRLPPTNRVEWRNDSTLQDADGSNDLTGGYYDAGDYIKATLPLAHSLFSICWGANVYGKGYENSNQTAYLDEMLRWGLDWLMKANPNPETLYVQIGDTNVDNDYWGGDQNIPLPRPAYQVNQTHPGTDVVALTSSAFSACSILYSNFSLSPGTSMPASLKNTTYASSLLRHAAQLYGLAQQTPFQSSSNVFKGYDLAYPGTTYEDELVLAEILVGLAIAANSTTTAEASPTGKLPQEHLNTAVQLYNENSLQSSNQDVVFNWATHTPVIPLLFAQTSALNNSNLLPAGGLGKWQKESEVYFDRVLALDGRGQLTSGGLLWYDGDSDLASLNPAMNAAALLFMYAPMATSGDKGTKYLNFAQGQFDYALGKNKMHVPYIVGSNPNSPSNPHDAKSSGGSDIGAIDTSPVDSLHTIYGAVVGGPNRDDKFWDIRSDWPQTEIAIDYNAPFLTLAAYSRMYNNNPPFFTSLAPGMYDSVRPSGFPCDPAFPCTAGNPGLGLNKAEKIAMSVGISVPGFIILVLVAWLIILSLRRRTKT